MGRRRRSDRTGRGGPAPTRADRPRRDPGRGRGHRGRGHPGDHPGSDRVRPGPASAARPGCRTAGRVDERPPVHCRGCRATGETSSRCPRSAAATDGVAAGRRRCRVADGDLAAAALRRCRASLPHDAIRRPRRVGPLRPAHRHVLGGVQSRRRIRRKTTPSPAGDNMSSTFRPTARCSGLAGTSSMSSKRTAGPTSSTRHAPRCCRGAGAPRPRVVFAAVFARNRRNGRSRAGEPGKASVWATRSRPSPTSDPSTGPTVTASSHRLRCRPGGAQ